MFSACDDQAPRQAFYQLFTTFFFKKNLILGGTFPHAARLVMIVLITVVTVAERTSGSFLVEKTEHDIYFTVK